MKQILWIVTLAIGSGTLAHAQTIADVARQERARRQAGSATAITNATLKVEAAPFKETVKQEGAAQASAPDGPDGPAAATAQTGKEAPVRDEKWWREEFAKARTDVLRVESQVTVLDGELKKANMEYLTRSFDPDGRGRTAINEATAKLDAAQKELVKAREKLPQLEEEMRRSGAPAGWAR